MLRETKIEIKHLDGQQNAATISKIGHEPKPELVTAIKVFDETSLQTLKQFNQCNEADTVLPWRSPSGVTVSPIDVSTNLREV